MNWKEFFKPSWRKFSIFLFIALLYSLTLSAWFLENASTFIQTTGIALTGVSLNKTSNEIQNDVQNQTSILYFNILPRYRIYWAPFTFGTTYFFPNNFVGLFLILSVVYWYLLACLIDFLYKKIRGSRK